MHVKKSLLAAGIATTIGLAGVTGVRAVSAATTSSSGSDGSGGISSLVSKIADKFNLKESDVQAVFDENRTEMEAAHQKAFEEKVAAAVKDGTITQDQADAIITKQKEMQSERESGKDAMQSMTDAERQAAMQQKQTEMQQWASDNGLSEDVLRDLLMGGGMRMGGGPDGGRMFHTSHDTSGSSTSTDTTTN